MSIDLSHVAFKAKIYGERWPRDMDELVFEWIRYQLLFDKDKDAANRDLFWTYDAVSDLCSNEPDLALEFIPSVVATKPERSIVEILAAGPLEDLLSNHGAKVIDKMKRESEQKPSFRNLFGGVWKNAMPEDVWERVLRIAPRR